MTVTIRDVARRLQLSITTVSRALDGYSDVAEETRKEVIRVAREMGYVPNRAARQLRNQRSDTIGYILPSSSPRLSEPFYSEFLAGLGDEAGIHGLDLLVTTAAPDDNSEKEAYRRWVQGRKVDGLILNRLRMNDWRVGYLIQENYPFTSLEDVIDGQDYEHYACVEVDGKTGLSMAVAHLAACGHKRIGYIGGGQGLKLQADRMEGYRAGLEEAGLQFDPDLTTFGNMGRQEGYEAALRLLSLPNPPTAIACVNDLTAIGVLQAAHELGLGVGRDLAVTGFDGIAGSAHTQPPLTTLDQPLYDIARLLVRMLYAIIQGETLEERRVFIKPTLIVRESSCMNPDSVANENSGGGAVPGTGTPASAEGVLKNGGNRSLGK